MGQVATLGDQELLPPDPDSHDSKAPESDIVEGLSLRMTQVMNHYQREEHCCFVCGATDHFARDCPHQETFHTWHKEHLNSKGAGQKKKAPDLTKPPEEVSMWMATTCCTSSLFADGPTTHWVGSETLVTLQVEGQEINTLADSGSQVHMVTPGYVCKHEFPVLSLHDLVDHPLNLIGLGGTRT